MRLQEEKQLPEFKGKQRIILEWIWRKIVQKLNDVRVSSIELIKPGNVEGDDDNWRWAVNSNGDLVSEHKESGSWVERGQKTSGS